MIGKKEAEQLIDEDKAVFVEEYHIQDDMFEQIYTYKNFKIILPVYGNERYSLPEMIEVEKINK